MTLNSDKTKFISLNSPPDVKLTAGDNKDIGKVEDFKYLGSFVMNSARDIKIRKAKAWKALNGMTKVWKSDMSRLMKKRFFFAAVESVLLYGSETWTLTPAMEKSINGCYTRMLRAAFNISWRDHLSNDELYRSIPKVTDKIQSRRLQLAGHSHRHPELPAHHVLTWQPTHGNRGRGRPATSYVQTLMRDVGAVTIDDLKNMMGDRQMWRDISRARPWPPE